MDKPSTVTLPNGFTIKQIDGDPKSGTGRFQVLNPLGNNIAYFTDRHEAHYIAQWLGDYEQIRKQRDKAIDVLSAAIKEWPKDQCLTQKHAVALAYNLIS